MLTLGDLCRRNAERWTNKDAYVEEERRVSWGEFDRRTDQLGAALRAMGVKPGDRVAMLGYDCVETAEVFMACAKIGAVRVGLNPRLAAREIAALMQDCGASILFVAASSEALVGEAAAAQPALPLIGFGAGHAQAIDYERLIATEHGIGRLPQTPSPVVMIAYTTGSTGLPKGAVYEHGPFLQSIMMIALCEGVDSSSVWLHAMPAAGIPIMHMFRNIFHGSTTVIVGPWDAQKALRLIRNERTTNTVLVPTMLNSLLACGDLGSTDTSSMRLLGYGASTLPAATIRAAMQAFDCPFLQMYGTTELMGMGMMLFPSDHALGLSTYPEILTSTGKALPYVDVKVIDDDGNVLGAGEVGELIIYSEYRFKEYLNNPQQTADALRDGWIHTGDIGQVSPEGYVFLHDRAKFKMKTGGYLVYPTEVENALAEHDAVDEVAVVGIPDERWGDRIEALITLKPSTRVDEAALLAFCKERIASFKVPKRIVISDLMPKGPTGKIQKLDVIKVLKQSAEQAGGAKA
ncbi:MAG TPA: AMP-binding protein [Bordetella sp.]